MLFENNLIFSLIKVILITSFTLGMMSSLTEFKFRVKKIFFIFGIYLIWVALSSAVTLYYWGFSGVIRAFLFTISAPAIFLAYLMDKSSPAQSVFNYATQIVFSLVLTMMTVLLNMAISGNQYTDLLIRAVSYSSVIYLEYRFLRRPFRRLINVIQTGWGILSLIPVFFCLLLVLIGTVPVHYINHRVSILYNLGVIVTMLVVYFVVYQSLMRQYRVQMLSHDKDVLQVQISAMNNQADAVLTAEKKLQILRHDVRHFAAVVQSELRQGSSKQAAAVLSNLEASARETTAKFYCDNYIINSILASYFQKAEEEGFKVKVNFSTVPTKKVDATAFSVMLANALENALEACRQESGNRSIELKSRVFNGQYLMELSNTCSAGVQFDPVGMPLSRKGKGHGIGTRSILTFAKEQNATISFQVASGKFILQMILDLTE